MNNALKCYSRTQNTAEGLLFLEERLDSYSESLGVLSWYAWLLKENKKSEKAVSVYQDIFDEGYRGDEDLIDYVKLMIDMRRLDRVEKDLEKYLEGGQSLELLLQRAELHYQQGRYTKGLEFTAELEEGRPFHADILFKKIDFLFALEDYDDAIELTETLISKEVYPAYSYFLKGKAEYYLESYGNAKASLEKAAGFSPENSQVQEFLAKTKAKLGES